MKKRPAKTKLITFTETVAGYPEIATPAPGKLIKANKIVQPSIVSSFHPSKSTRRAKVWY